MSVNLLVGEVGEAGALYQLSAALSDQFGKQLNATVILRDYMGAVKDGYGPSSFYPQWITQAQRSSIMNHFAGSVRSYLSQTADPIALRASR
jgi:hypothetical protein